MGNNDDTKHAVLSPSTAERWFNCPGSLRLGRGKRSVSGPAALEGTKAHEFAANILLEEIPIDDIPDEDMRSAVSKYIDFVNNLETSYEEEYEWMVEEKVDLRHLGGDCWGTLDYSSWIIGDDLYVCDYKNGLVTVEVKDNKQLLTYATGLCEKIGYDFKHIYIVIIQPRAAHVNGPIRSQRLTPAALKAFRGRLVKAIEATKDKLATLQSGSWCQYCPAIGHCPEIVGTAQELAKIEFADGGSEDNLPVIETITDDQLYKIVEHNRVFRAWLDGCLEEAADRLNKGRDISGLKLVRSPGRSKWRDPDNLPRLYHRTVPMTITEARRLVSEKDRLLLESWIERPEGKIVAVPDDDGRALYISPKVEFE